MANKRSSSAPSSHSTKKDFLLFMSIPVAIILLVMAFVLGPSLFAKPHTDFVFAYCPDYDCQYSYRATANGGIETAMPRNYDSYARTLPELYYFDTDNNTATKISLNQAKQYRLNTSNVSPDGYTLKQNSSSSGFLFWGSSDYSWYLKKGIAKKQVNLPDNSSGSDITFLGWIR